MDVYFRTLNCILNERKLSNRICLIIMNLIDLRKNGWKSRREDIVIPTTIDKIREEVDRDEQERELGCKPKQNYASANAPDGQSDWRKKREELGND